MADNRKLVSGTYAKPNLGKESARLTQFSDVGDLKAITLNLMHKNLSITTGIYAILSDADVRTRIDALGMPRI